MKNLYSILNENKKEAIELFKANFSDNNIIDIDEFINNEVMSDNYPYVLFQNRHLEILDCSIQKIRLDLNDTFEVYTDTFDEWVDLNDALSTSENCVYTYISELVEALKK